LLAAIASGGVVLALVAACSPAADPHPAAAGVGLPVTPTPGPSAVVPTTIGGSGSLAVSTPVLPDAPLDDKPAPGSGVPAARAGKDGVTQRHTFAPSSITLDLHGTGSASATVDVIDTGTTGELGLPADPGQVGWWQSGALAGDAFGSVVLAGHVDAKYRGIGFFARLRNAQPGDEVVLSDGAYQQRYRVTSTRSIPKASLSTTTDTFSQTVPGRLVLITCTGTWSSTTHYPDNLIVTAEPVGVPAPR
jgi:LPXTG-site transpeptidase (sortase) family protein